jgi:hypothetical protein
MTGRAAIALAVGLGAAAAADVLVGAEQPGVTAPFTLVVAALLVVVPKWLAARGLQRPEGTRPGELGDPADRWVATEVEGDGEVRRA